jgi:aspartyl-tRNA(Asn)/glutamyl-tRNA(Gln) amidotransferase subunit A
MSSVPPSRTAREFASVVNPRTRSAREACEHALGEIERLDSRLHAFLEITGEFARGRADRIDEDTRASRAVGPLAGVPVAVKDNICTSFGHTTCASNMLREYRSPYDATAIRRLETAGAVVVGKTNLDEFGMGSSTETSAWPPTRNPWNPECVPGGSSGGSAVAVAAGMTPLALGSDTGGSVRQPAAFCGVVGLKPTYGRVSRYGLVAFASSLDQIGPIAGDVADCALLLHAIAGEDPLDSTCLADPVPDYAAALGDNELDHRRRHLKIGLPREYFDAGLDREVRAAVENAAETYRRMGVEIVELSLPHTAHCIATYYLIATAECSSNLARFDGIHYGRRAPHTDEIIELYSRSRAEGFGDEVKRRIMLGTFALSAGYADQYYHQALKARRLIQMDFERAFEQVEVLLCPTTPAPAFRFGEKLDDPLQMYLADVYTTAANLAGIPAISLPCGFSAAGLPIGLQLMAPPLEETRLLQVARLYERETDWHTRRPPLAMAGNDV